MSLIKIFKNYSYGILLILLANFKICYSQQKDWVNLYNLKYVSNSTVIETKAKCDKELEIIFGKKRFSKWLVDVQPIERIKIVTKDGPLLPYEDPKMRYQSEFDLLCFQYHFNISGFGDFYVLPLDTVSINCIPPIKTNPKRWSLISPQKANKIIKENGAEQFYKSVNCVDQHFCLLLTSDKEEWILRLDDGKLIKGENN